MNWHRTKQSLLTKPPRWSWNGNIRTENPSCVTLETYKKTPLFIPVDILEDAVKSVARTLSGSSGPGGKDSEALQG